jgi:hypothetical protein
VRAAPGIVHLPRPGAPCSSRTSGGWTIRCTLARLRGHQRHEAQELQRVAQAVLAAHAHHAAVERGAVPGEVVPARA